MKKRRSKKRMPHRHALGVYGVIAMAVLSIAALIGAAWYTRSYLQSDGMAAVISAVLVDLANDDRESGGLGSLTVNPLLVAAAQAKADDMASKSYFAHDSPDGKKSWYWFKEAGYSFSYAGENLAIDFSDSGDVEDAWMKSPTHRANILNGHFTEVGIATAVGTYQGRETVFVVQMFGSPAASKTQPEIVQADTNVPAERVAVAKAKAPAAVPTETVKPVAASAETIVSGSETPAPIQVEGGGSILGAQTPDYAPFWEHLAASPKTLLRAIYLVSAFLLLILLLSITRLEFKKHHSRHFAAAGVTLVLIGGLFVNADRFVFVDPIIGQLPAGAKV